MPAIFAASLRYFYKIFSAVFVEMQHVGGGVGDEGWAGGWGGAFAHQPKSSHLARRQGSLSLTRSRFTAALTKQVLATKTPTFLLCGDRRFSFVVFWGFFLHEISIK